MSPYQLNVLGDAIKLLEKGWTQNHWSLDAAGAPVYHRDQAACQFCLQGALMRAEAGRLGEAETDDDIYRCGELIEAEIAAECGCNSVIQWNDTPGRTREEVVSTLRRVYAKPATTA